MDLALATCCFGILFGVWNLYGVSIEDLLLFPWISSLDTVLEDCYWFGILPIGFAGTILLLWDPTAAIETLLGSDRFYTMEDPSSIDI